MPALGDAAAGGGRYRVRPWKYCARGTKFDLAWWMRNCRAWTAQLLAGRDAKDSGGGDDADRIYSRLWEQRTKARKIPASCLLTRSANRSNRRSCAPRWNARCQASAACRTGSAGEIGGGARGALPLRILLVDDNAINQKVAVRILQQMGYRPEVAANGREALDAIERQPVDLIFMDVMMPEMDGMEATRHIRKRQMSGEHKNYQSHIIIVAMTAHAMQGDREKCLAAGMDDYLAKPIRPKDVRDMIVKWGGKAAMDSSRPRDGSGGGWGGRIASGHVTGERLDRRQPGQPA